MTIKQMIIRFVENSYTINKSADTSVYTGYTDSYEIALIIGLRTIRNLKIISRNEYLNIVKMFDIVDCNIYLNNFDELEKYIKSKCIFDVQYEKYTCECCYGGTYNLFIKQFDK
jgi:hypothetical protein